MLLYAATGGVEIGPKCSVIYIWFKKNYFR